MNLVNMGIGVRSSSQQSQDQVNGDAEEEQEEPDEEAEMSRDVQFFKVAVEEAEERFPGDQGEERIREVVGIMKRTIRSNCEEEIEVKENGVHDSNG